MGVVVALALGGCGDDDGLSCERVADVPDGATCLAIGNELTCGRTFCGGTLPDVDTSDECQAVAAAELCDQFEFEDGACRVAGCACLGFQAEGAACTLSGCRTCGHLCGFELTDVPDAVACATSAVDRRCVTTISYDVETQVCVLSGCQNCTGAP